MFAAHLAVLQKVGKDFQKMRFTTSKETGDPHTHLRGGSGDTLFIRCKEIHKMLLQFFGHNILFQLLLDVGIFILTNDDDSLDFSINRFANMSLINMELPP
jgi:hypothetical protein